ncbi:MAG: RNA 2',3'-cyclic phosphodiesterase [Halorubrum sp.]
MRAFFAVDLPDDLTDPLAEVQSTIDDAAGLTTVDPAQAHVTLKFLGDVPTRESDGPNSGAEAEPSSVDGGPTVDDVVEAGAQAIDDADLDPFDCSVAGLGVFPSLEYISVVWAGVDQGSAALTRLHESLEAETIALGIDPEDHAFTPHVTLGRLNGRRGKALIQRAVQEQHPVVGSFTVSEIRLVESTLTPEGPCYEPVETFELG